MNINAVVTLMGIAVMIVRVAATEVMEVTGAGGVIDF
jgi:hypothetical protein